MRIKKFLLSAMLLLLALSTNAAVKTEGNCVTVDVERPAAGGARVVCLEVINDNIIRVRATSESTLPKKHESLMIVKQTAKPQFTTSEKGDIVEVKAKNVTAQVDKKTGQITFFDADGKRLAKETKDGKTFFDRSFTKADFRSLLSKDFQKYGIMDGLRFNHAEEGKLYFNTCVSLPDSDMSCPFFLTIGPDGSYTITPDTTIDEDALPTPDNT